MTNIKIFYSSHSQGFYPSDVHGENLPQDALELTPEEYHGLMEGQAAGMQICPPDETHLKPYLAEPKPVPVDRKTEILRELCRIDETHRTPRTLANAHLGDTEALERLKTAEEMCCVLREELNTLE